MSIPYLFSACAQLSYLVSKRCRVQGWLAHRERTGQVAPRAETAQIGGAS